jgi:hypothetical protein
MTNRLRSLFPYTAIKKTRIMMNDCRNFFLFIFLKMANLCVIVINFIFQYTILAKVSKTIKLHYNRILRYIVICPIIYIMLNRNGKTIGRKNYIPSLSSHYLSLNHQMQINLSTLEIQVCRII